MPKHFSSITIEFNRNVSLDDDDDINDVSRALSELHDGVDCEAFMCRTLHDINGKPFATVKISS